MDKETLYRNLNEGMLAERLEAFRRNLEKNLGSIRKYGGIQRVLPELRDRHVCVAGAGPSLDGCLGHLKKYQHRRELVLIAVDMALLPLVRSGIRPAFVMSCETMPVDFFGGSDTAGMHLLAFSCMSPVNLKKWKGDISFFNWMMQGPGYDGLWERAGRGLGSVATGNIVTTQAVALALGCGIRSLLLVGNDLAFGRSYYARGSVSHDVEHRRSDRFSPAAAAEMNSIRRRRDYELHRGGSLFFTSHQFLAAKTWLEDLLARQSTPVFDCSNPGLSEKSAKKTGLREYLSRFDRRNPSRR
jgi:hypothetical protein